MNLSRQGWALCVRRGVIKIYDVLGNSPDQDFRFPQVQAVAGGRNHLNLPQRGHRPIGEANLPDLVSQFEIVAGARDRLNLLFWAVV